MKRTYKKGAGHKIAKKVSSFEDHAENFYSDKAVHFFNMEFHAISTLQRNRALFLKSVVFWKKRTFVIDNY